jgi:hypothetical protein
MNTRTTELLIHIREGTHRINEIGRVERWSKGAQQWLPATGWRRDVVHRAAMVLHRIKEQKS